MKIVLIFTMMILFLVSFCNGAIITSNKSGNFHVANNWNGGSVPGVNDTAVIQSSHTITIARAGDACKRIIVDIGGQLTVNFTFTLNGNAIINGNVGYGTGGRLNVSGALTRNNLSGTGPHYLFSLNNYVSGSVTSITIQEFPNTAPPNTAPTYDATLGVKRYYTISNVVGSGDVKLRLDYLATEMGSAFTRTNGEVWRYLGAEGPWIPQGPSLPVPTENFAETPIAFDVSTLAATYAVADGNAALPVQLASFTGSYVTSTSVKLDWMTLSEINNNYFNVQKFNTAINDYETIGVVYSLSGNTTQPQYYSYVDENIIENEVQYRLEQVDLNGLSHLYDPITVIMSPAGVKDGQIVPKALKLNQNYPNPFNPFTIINYQLPVNGNVTMKVYNILGNKVATLVDGYKEAGYYSVTFDGKDLSSGIYFYKLQSGSNVEVKKLTLVK